MADSTELAVRGIEALIGDNITDMDAGWTEADNIAFAGQDFAPGAEDWMRPRVLFGDSDWGTSGTVGTGQNVIVGILTTSFFVRPGSGLGAVRGYIAGFRALLDRRAITLVGHGDVEFGPAGGPRTGPGDSTWEHLIVDCPFTVEEHGA